MKKIILILASLLLVNLAYAQAPQFQWAKGIGGNAYDFGQSLATDASGNVYNTGYFEGTVDFDSGTNVFNLTSSGTSGNGFISKYDAAGNFIWAKQISAECYPTSITIDGVGNIYTTGSFSSIVDFDPSISSYSLSPKGLDDIFVLKLDASGNFVWAKSIGGTESDLALEVKTDIFDNVYVTGFFRDTVDFNPGAGIYNLNSSGFEDIFILKLDGAGNYLWVKTFGSTSSDYSNAITLDSSGNIYVSGVFTGTVDFDSNVGTYNLTSSGSEDAFILKLDMNGNFVWANKVGDNFDDGIVSVKIDLFGNIYCTGYFQQTVDFDSGQGIYNLTSVGMVDAFILKLDVFGNFIWAKQIGGLGQDYAYSSAIDASGNIYTTGYFETTADFNPGIGNFILISNGDYDAFILKLDLNGDFVWAKSMGGIFSDQGQSISVTSSNELYITGTFSDNSSFFDSYTLSANGETDVFIVKMGNQSVGIKENVGNYVIEIYPNPSNGNFYIESSKLIENRRIEIYNSLGVLVQEETVDQNISHVYLSGYPRGLYFLKVFSKDDLVASKKVLIE